MATLMNFLANYVDSDVAYVTTPADYILMDLTNDYLIWTEEDDVVKDLMTHEPTTGELNAAAVIIDDAAAVTIPHCLLMDYSHNVGGSYYTHEILGIAGNHRYVFCFSFDGATASEPRLEAWDTSAHTTIAKNVLGATVAASSMVKGVCTTTTALPGASWVGTTLAGASNYLLLNAGRGALATPGTGLTTELYANLKIVIPMAFATPAAETFVFTTRYTWSS